MSALDGKGLFHLAQAAPESWDTIPCGTPLMAVQDLKTLQETGLPTGMAFGIMSTGENVIRQTCCNEDTVDIGQMHTAAEFCVDCVPMGDFCPEEWSLLYMENAGNILDLKKTHRKAEYSLGSVFRHLRSFPGDDLVAECLVPLAQNALATDTTHKGQHWWTPLHYNAEELTKLIEDATGITLPRVLPESTNPTLLQLQHHGIALEGGWMIHFATCRVPDGCNQVKLDTVETFCSITPYVEEKGGPLQYKDDSEHKRLLHRNRAVWLLCHAAQWGEYNLFTNNCEHLCRMCKVGNKQSAQVTKAWASAILSAASVFIPGGVLVRILASLGLPLLLHKLLPSPASSGNTSEPTS